MNRVDFIVGSLPRTLFIEHTVTLGFLAFGHIGGLGLFCGRERDNFTKRKINVNFEI